MQQELRKSGIDFIGDVPWSSHFCQFYQTRQDLLDILVPYFKAGLENNESCVWVTSAPLTPAIATRAMRTAMPDFDSYLKKGQIEIFPYDVWYRVEGVFDMDRVLAAWVSKYDMAISRGFAGLRVTGNTAWLEKKDWSSFRDYEAAINGVVGKYKMLVLCTYSLEKSSAGDVLDVMNNHEFAVIKSGGEWKTIANTVYQRAKDALTASERRYRQLIETTTEGVWVAGIDGRTIYINQRMADMLGCKIEDCLKSRRDDFFDPEYYAYAMKIRAEREKGITGEYEMKLRRTDGSPLWVLVSGSPVYDEAGNHIANLGMHKDITDRKHAEEALEENRRSLQRATDLLETITRETQVIMAAIDNNFNYTYFNAAYRAELKRLTGKDIEIGANMLEAFAHLPEQQAVVAREWSEVLRGENTNKTLDFGDPGIHRRTYNVLHTPIRDFDKVVGAGEVAYDVTEQKQMEEKLALYRDHLEELVRERSRELAESEERFRNLVDNAPVAMSLSTYEVGPVTRNIYNAKMLGYDSVEELLSIPGEATFADPADRKRLFDLAEKGQANNIEIQRKRKDGSLIWVSHTAVPLKAGSDNFIFLSIDIDERKRTEEELAQYREHLQELVKQRTAALEKANIDLFSEIAERKQAEEIVKRNETRLETLLKISQYRASNVRDILDFALNEAVKLSGSTIGYIYRYEEEKRQFILNSWSKEVADECTIIQPETVYDLDKTGIWGEVVRQKRAVIVNDFNAPNPSKKGYPTGHARLYRWMGIPVIQQGKIVATLGIANKPVDYDSTDIQQLTLLMDSVWNYVERQRAEQALEESEQRYRQFIETASEGIWVVDTTGITTYVNQRLADSLGYSRVELIGKMRTDFIEPEDVPALIRLREERRKGLASRYESRFRRKDGTLIWMFVSGSPIFDSAGKHTGNLGMHMDITDRKQAEEALKVSEEKYRSIVETTNEGIITSDLSGHLTFVNERFADMLGYKTEEMVGRSPQDYATPEFQAVFAEQRIDRNRGFSDSWEIKLRRKDGGDIWVIMSGTPLYDSEKKHYADLAMVTDITDRKQVEEALHRLNIELENRVKERTAELEKANEDLVGEISERKQAEERIRYLATFPELNPTPVLEIDEGGKVLYSNPAVRYIFPGIEKLGIAHPYFAGFDALREIIRRSGAPPFAREINIGDYWYEQIFHYLPETRRFRIYGRNITNRKKLEVELRAASDYARGLIEASLDPLVTINREGKITDVNRATELVTGVARAQLIGNDFSDFFTEPEKARESYHEVFAKGYTRDYPLTIRHVSGKTIDVLYNATVYRDEEGEVEGVFAAARDITEIKRLEIELRRSNSDLQQLAYITSHDLQEPLRMITSYLQLIERRYKNKLDADADEFIGYAVDGAARMRTMINDLLEYSRIETRGKTLQSVSAESAITAALSNLEVAISENNAIVTHDPLPVIRADATQLTMLFQNLIGNGIKFHGKEAPHVHVSAKKQGGEWLFSVSDNGIGIEPQYFGRLFQVFQRLHTRDEYPGTGIGLALCKRIVERHGGRIWVESEAGRGATFYFTIPVEGHHEQKQ